MVGDGGDGGDGGDQAFPPDGSLDRNPLLGGGRTVTIVGGADTLVGVRAALRPEGRLVFETRDPAKQAWT